MRLVFLSSLTALAACSQAPALATTASFDLSNFDQVDLMGPDSIRVLPGPRFAVTAEGPQATLDQLDLRVEHGVLKVGRMAKKGWHWNTNKAAVHITITMPVVHGVTLSGAGDVDVLAPVKGDRFVADVSGTGDLKIQSASVQAVEVHISGTGDVSLSGDADQLTLGVSGTGDVDARNLNARLARLDVSGVGDIRAHVSERVTGGISGVGDIDVTGGAQCDMSSSGAGAVHCAP